MQVLMIFHCSVLVPPMCLLSVFILPVLERERIAGKPLL